MRGPRLARLAAGLLFVGTVGTSAQVQQPAGALPATRSPRALAQADLTGYWVAQITEDWRFRMMTPPKGDYMGLPLNAAGRKIADGWDLAKDTAEGALCKAFGAGGLMRHPLRVRITWANDYTLKLETDLGQKTRLFHFRAQTPGARSLQGHSVAQWSRPARGASPAPAAPAAGGLKAVTTHLTPGYLRKNGVPYSENTVVTEYYDRISFFGIDYLQLVAVVEDPTYLTRPLIVSNQFKREPDGSKWNPQPCTIDPPIGVLRPESS